MVRTRPCITGIFTASPDAKITGQIDRQGRTAASAGDRADDSGRQTVKGGNDSGIQAVASNQALEKGLSEHNTMQTSNKELTNVKAMIRWLM
jgi:hypothetical protein